MDRISAYGIQNFQKPAIKAKSTENTSKYSSSLSWVPIGSFNLMRPEKMKIPTNKNFAILVIIAVVAAVARLSK